MKRRRWTKGLAMLAAAVLTAIGAAGTASARETESFSSKGVSADAFWESCTTQRGVTTCTFTSLFAFEGTERSSETGTTRGAHVCLSIDRFSFREGPGRGPGGGESSFESGCTQAPSGTLVVAGDLSSATLAATTVALDTYECSEEEEECTIVSSRDVTVSGSWAGAGPVFSFSDRFRFSDGTCTETFSGKGKSREAVATATIDGTSLGDSAFAAISSGMFTFRLSCA